MHTLSAQQADDVSGGLLWTAPVAVAIADTACLNPLVLSFTAGWAVGTYIYRHYME